MKNLKEKTEKNIQLDDSEVIVRNKEKRLITENTENGLINIIIQYAKEKGLTFSNILEAVCKVETYMNDNAILDKD